MRTKILLAAPALLAALALAPAQAGDAAQLTQLKDSAGRALLAPALAARAAASPCAKSIAYFAVRAANDPRTRRALQAALAQLQDPPPAYGVTNPWRVASLDALVSKMVSYFTDWCVFLPDIAGTDGNGLRYIQGFAWFYYHNAAAKHFVQGRDPGGAPLATGRHFLQSFARERGAYMDAPGAAAAEKIAQWIRDPRIEIEDYARTRPEEYRSWNDFFARELRRDQHGAIPSRPVAMPERDYIVSAPTDCIMNALVQTLRDARGQATRRYIENPLDANTVIDVKGAPLSVDALLGDAPAELKAAFVGGSGLSCILMPNTYHHFHAPVSGTVAYAGLAPDGTFGYEDWPNWAVRTGNVARPGTDFSQFQAFQRGVVIIEVTYKNLDGRDLTGHVALIPVGLNTIGSVVLNDAVKRGARVVRGRTQLGHFRYGGSLNILLFSKGLMAPAVQTRMGAQIGLLNTVGKAR